MGACSRAAPSPATSIPHPYRKSSRAQARRSNRHGNKAASWWWWWCCLLLLLLLSCNFRVVGDKRAQSGHVAAICRAVPPMQIANVTTIFNRNLHQWWCATMLIAGRSCQVTHPQNLSGTQKHCSHVTVRECLHFAQANVRSRVVRHCAWASS